MVSILYFLDAFRGCTHHGPVLRPGTGGVKKGEGGSVMLKLMVNDKS